MTDPAQTLPLRPAALLVAAGADCFGVQRGNGGEQRDEGLALFRDEHRARSVVDDELRRRRPLQRVDRAQGETPGADLILLADVGVLGLDTQAVVVGSLVADDVRFSAAVLVEELC